MELTDEETLHSIVSQSVAGFSGRPPVLIEMFVEGGLAVVVVLVLNLERRESMKYRGLKKQKTYSQSSLPKAHFQRALDSNKDRDIIFIHMRLFHNVRQIAFC